MTKIIHNVTIFTNNDTNDLLHGQAVAIDGNRIAAVGSDAALTEQFPNAERMDGGGRLLMPGYSNDHMHFYGTFARGIALNTTPTNFPEILQHLWWALDKSLDLDAVYYSALIPSIGAIKKGVTSVIDHHASPNAVDGSLDRIEDALNVVGSRGILCYEVSDRDGMAIRDAGIAENERYIRKCAEAKRANADHKFDAMMGLHASFTLSNESLEKAAAGAKVLDRGCHIHMLEDIADETRTQEQFGISVVNRLHDFGILNEKSIAAHGIFLDDAGVELVRDSGAIVTHQAQSNMNNAVGRADVFKLLASDILVGLGTDGMTPDIRAETRSGYLMHRHHLGDPTVGWGEFEKMLLKNNPAIYQQLSGQMVGQVTEGWLADLILVDYFPPTPLTSDNFWGHFLFGLFEADVNTTIIDGNVVMHNKEIAGIDEAQIAADSQVVVKQVWERFAKI